jgi:hypothetical protein
MRKMSPSEGWTPSAALAGVLVQHEHMRAEIGPASQACCSGDAMSSDSIRCCEDDGDWLGRGLLGCMKRLGRCCMHEKEEKSWAAWAAGKRKEEKKNWAGWGIWPKRLLGLKNPLYFLVFESNLNLNRI